MNPHATSIYYSFKRKLLLMMAETDPLEILHSGIFEQFQAQLLPQSILQNINHHQQYQTKIASYQFMDPQQQPACIAYKMVERRSKSADKYSNMPQKMQEKERKIERLQQKNKVQFAIWSNILANSLTSFHPNKASNKNIESNEFSSTLSIKDKKQQKQNKDPQYQQISQKQILYNVSELFQLTLKKCLTNFSPKALQSALKILEDKVVREIAFTYQYSAQLHNENEKLRKKIEQYSRKELQFIIKQKDYKKQIARMKKQLQNYSNDHERQMKQLHASFETQKHSIFQKLKNFDKNYMFIDCNGEGDGSEKNLTAIEKLREKIMIDSVRRNMLLGVDRQKWEIQLKKEELGITRIINQHFSDEQHGQQTLDTDHF